MAVILAIFWMYLMSNCARCLAITSVALIMLIFVGGGAFCIVYGITGGGNKDATTGLYAGGGGLLFFGLIFSCCLYCNRNSLETAIAIIDASADFFIDTKRIVFVSIFYFFVAMIFFFLWVACEVSALSMNDFTKGPGP